MDVRFIEPRLSNSYGADELEEKIDHVISLHDASDVETHWNRDELMLSVAPEGVTSSRERLACETLANTFDVSDIFMMKGSRSFKRLPGCNVEPTNEHLPSLSSIESAESSRVYVKYEQKIWVGVELQNIFDPVEAIEDITFHSYRYGVICGFIPNDIL